MQFPGAREMCSSASSHSRSEHAAADRRDETVDTQDTSHDDRDDGAHDQIRAHDTHGADADTGPSPVRVRKIAAAATQHGRNTRFPLTLRVGIISNRSVPYLNGNSLLNYAYSTLLNRPVGPMRKPW